MKEFIEAIKSGDLVEAKKHFGTIMEDRKESLRQELRVQLAESVRIEGEEDTEDDEPNGDEENDKNKGDKKPKDEE